MKPAYELLLTSAARRSLSEELPEAVAAAVWRFITGDLLAKPHRVGVRLRDELDDTWSARRGMYWVLYRILEQQVVVEVVKISHRRDVYR